MSHHPVNDENQRPQHEGQGDGANASQGSRHSNNEPRRDTSRFLLSEPTTDRATLVATNKIVDNDLVLALKELDVNSSGTNAKDDTQTGEEATTENEQPRIGANRCTESGELITEEDRLFSRERKVVLQYLLDNVAEFRELSDIRLKARKQFPISFAITDDS